jgi:outer membrane protein assembly factor BamB
MHFTAVSDVAKNIAKISLLLAVFVLAACGASPKDYSNATPLSSITTKIKVNPLWAVETDEVPEYRHVQFPLVIVDNKIYVVSARGDVSVLAADTGKQQWSASLNEVLTGGPGVGAGLIFVGTREAEIVALNKNDGAEQWRQRISSEMLARPQVVDNLLIVQTIDGKLSALAADTGKSLWRYDHAAPKLTLRGTSDPIVIGDYVVAGFADGKLVKLNRSTGELQWETTIAVPRGRTDLERLVDIDGLFQISDEIIYVSSFQGGIAAVSLADGNVLWRRDMSSFVGLTIDPGQVYVSDVDGKVWALDSRTGATLWRQDKLEGRETSVPTIMGDNIVVADYEGFVHWLSKQDGQIVARQNLEKLWQNFGGDWLANVDEPDDMDVVFRSVTAAPVAIGNTLYVRDNLGALTVFEILSEAH